MVTINNIDFDALDDTEKGYLIGLFIGDGYAHYDNKQRHYMIEFYLHSERNIEIQEYLVNILGKIGLRCFVSKDKRFKCNRIKVHSMQLYDILFSEYHDNTNDYMIGYVSGLIDSEGYVNLPKSTIVITNTDLKILNRCKDYLEILGLKTEIKERVMSRKDKKKSYKLHVPVAFISINMNSLKLNRRKSGSQRESVAN